MAGCPGTPLWRKLGYRDGIRAFVSRPPPGYRGALGLPGEVRVAWSRRLGPGAAFVHLFESRRAGLARTLARAAGLMARDGVLWVSWPKRSSGVASDVTGDTVRELALPLGLVDVKVCSVDGTWSGLKLMIRRELRQAAPKTVANRGLRGHSRRKPWPHPTRNPSSG